MTDDAVREIYRSRWRREREKLGFIDIRQPGFATGGLGQYVPNLAVRLVILGGDPERERIEFDNEFWSWWKTNHESIRYISGGFGTRHTHNKCSGQIPSTLG